MVDANGASISVPGVRGCNVYDRCIFHMRRFGGFKGKGPRNIGYDIWTGERLPDGRIAQKQDISSCNQFVMTMGARMAHGQRQREEGNQNAEAIHVVAQEGETIETRVQVRLNEGRTNEVEKFDYRVEKRIVPMYQHPDAATGDSYEAGLERARRARNEEESSAYDFTPINPMNPFVPEPAPKDAPIAQPMVKR
jgi:hypothetical protein